LLRQQFGATRVVAFGSVIHRSWFTPWSDIDLVAWNVPTNEFYRAVAVVTGLSPEFEIDLLDPDTCPPALRQRVEQEGIEL
jgi:predicted nucleotidyltransferase